jgi:predicted Zn-dependent peptidase
MSIRSRRLEEGAGLSWAGLFLLLCALLAPPVQAQDDLRSRFEEKVTTFTLDNGLDFVVVERHDAPVVSFTTYADVGSVNEPEGKTGIAHMFEHMAFKGTTTIGTKNIQKEMAALERQEEVYLQLRRERMKPTPDSARIATLEKQFQAATEEAESYMRGGEFENILKKNGVEDLGAYTTADATVYQYSLPANKTELFFALESDRFANPVLREFYTERDVVMEERRQRVGSSPNGRLVEAYVTSAFKAHPYGTPIIGHMSDIQKLSRTDAEAFFDTYYNASNLTIGIAGDVDPARMRTLAEKYFGRLPEGEEPPPVRTEEPEQFGERRVVLREQARPRLMVGYSRPSMYSPDDPVYEVLADVLAGGRTSRFHERLVETETALAVQIPSYFAEFPGGKYENEFSILAFPNRGVSPDSLEHAIYDVLETVKEEGITQEELERAKTRARDEFIGQLDSNQGLAQQFAEAEALTGDWRSVFETLREIEAVTVEDVQRVARETFRANKRTVAIMKSPEGGAPTASAN